MDVIRFSDKKYPNNLRLCQWLTLWKIRANVEMSIFWLAVSYPTIPDNSKIVRSVAIPIQIPDTSFDLKRKESGVLLNFLRSNRAVPPEIILRLNRTNRRIPIAISPSGTTVMSDAPPSITRNITQRYQHVRIKIILFSQPTDELREAS